MERGTLSGLASGTQYADHQEMQAYVKRPDHLYAEGACLLGGGFRPNGFQWIECDDAESSIVSFVRRSKEGAGFSSAILPVVHRGFSLGVPQVTGIMDGFEPGDCRWRR